MRDKPLTKTILKYLSIEQIEAVVIGEALEYCRGAYICFYGNGEITIFNGDTQEPYATGSVSNVRGFKEILWDA